LSSLIENCRDTIKEKSHTLHDIAKKKVQLWKISQTGLVFYVWFIALYYQ
jgi:hypothetical protein